MDEFYISILKYLKSNDGIVHEVDLKPFIVDYLTEQNKKQTLFEALEFLHHRKYIETNSSYHDLITRYGTSYQNANFISFKMRLSEKGEDYISPKEYDKIHVSNSKNVVIGSNNNQSSERASIIKESPYANHTTSKKSNVIKKALIGIVIAVAAAIIFEIIKNWLGF